MAPQPPRARGLGRGLSALMSDINPEQKTVVPVASSSEQYIPIENVYPNPDQPRRTFDESDLADLANSIRGRGVIQPLIVRKHLKMPNSYEIVAGERRWRAAQLAKLHQVPVVVRELDDQSVLEIAIIENIQRADLNAIEEAAGYKLLMERFGHTQEKMAEAMGKSRSHIANFLRLLNLPAPVQSMVQHGDLSAGHARALITAENAVQLAEKVLSKGLSVRETEKLAKSGLKPKVKKAQRTPQDKDADTRALEADLSAALKMNVKINHPAGTETGEISIKYKDLDQLDDICRLLAGG